MRERQRELADAGRRRDRGPRHRHRRRAGRRGEGLPRRRPDVRARRRQARAARRSAPTRSPPTCGSATSATRERMQPARGRGADRHDRPRASTTSSRGSRSSSARAHAARDDRADVAWAIGRVYDRLAARALLARAARLRRASGSRATAASCSRSTTSAWIDSRCVGALSPRTIYYMAKVEAHACPGLGAFMRRHSARSRSAAASPTARRCGRCARSSRDGRVARALRRGHAAAERRPGQGAAGRGDGRDPGGRAGRPGRRLRHAVLAARQLRAGARSRAASRSRFDGLPKNGAGYSEASREIERRICALCDWLVEMHAPGARRAVPRQAQREPGRPVERSEAATRAGDRSARSRSSASRTSASRRSSTG